MSVIIAIGHIGGTLIVLMAFSFGILMLAQWETARNKKSDLQEVSIALGIPVDQLDSDEHLDTLIRFCATKFSSELLRNRFSDLCGLIQTGWGWLGIFFQVALILGVIWFTVTENLSNAINAWWIIAVGIFFWIFSVSFAISCKLLTGRYPGQARRARKILAETVQNRQRLSAHNKTA